MLGLYFTVTVVLYTRYYEYRMTRKSEYEYAFFYLYARMSSDCKT